MTRPTRETAAATLSVPLWAVPLLAIPRPAALLPATLLPALGGWRRLTLALFAAFALLASPGAATAHAFPQRTMPPAGSRLVNPPPRVAILFTEALEPRFSSLKVFDAFGHRVDRGDAHLGPHNARRYIVDLQPLPPGTYNVVWHVTSVDTHQTQGHFQFSVAR